MKMQCVKCGKCENVLDSNNPNIHYGNHVCSCCIKKSNEKLAKEYEKMQKKIKYCDCGNKLDNGDLYYKQCSKCKKLLNMEKYQ